MNIRKAAETDFIEILDIYAYARNFMSENGNPTQWAIWGYPEKELLEGDMKRGNLYVM